MMKYIPATLLLLFFSPLAFFAAAESITTSPLDQRNRPPVSPEAPRNYTVSARSGARKQHLSDPKQDLDYSYVPENILCYVNDNSSLSKDVSEAIDILKADRLHALRCNYNNTVGDREDQFCATLAMFESATIAICTNSMKRINCKKVAEISAVLSSKCEEEYDGEFRVGGKAKLTWGYIHIFNSTLGLEASG